MTDPAHNPDLERAVLSVMLDGRHPTTYATFVDLCHTPRVFFVRNHRLVIMAISLLAETGQRIDQLSVSTKLMQMPWTETWEALRALDTGKPARITTGEADLSDSAYKALGADGMAEITGAMGPPGGFSQNCRNLLAYYVQRQMAEVLQDALDRAHAVDGAEKSAEIADHAINRLAGLVMAQEGTATLSEAMRKAMSRHHGGAVVQDQRTASWGVPGLDRALPLRPCRYVVLAAQPGHGKSSLALQAATATAGEMGEAAVAMVNLEMPAEQIGTILLAREINATAKAIEIGKLTPEQAAAADVQIAAREARDIFLRTATRKVTIDEIAAWIRQRHVRSAGRLSLVVIDYLQLIGGKGRQTEYDRISEASQSLKLLANELRICLLVLSQLNREGTKSDRDSSGRSKGNPEPRMQDLRGSGSIEQDADAIVFIWPPHEVEGNDLPVRLKIAKNRGGPKPTVEASFERARGQMFRQTSVPSSLDPEGSSRAHHNHPPSPVEDRWADRDIEGQAP